MYKKQMTTLGNSNLSISRLGLGCMGMSEFYGITDDNESIKTIQRAYELGVNHFDTADSYGIGHNEKLLAKAIKGFDRDKIVVATKCGFVRRVEDTGFFETNSTPEYIKKCCEDSLKRLNLDYIDLFYLHRVNPSTPVEASMQALSDLVREGKIRNIGLSEVSAKTIAKAHQIHPLSAVQSEYSLWTREQEQEIIPLCKSLGISFVAFSPTGRGFFTGKLKTLDTLEATDSRRLFPRFEPENMNNNQFIVTILEDMAKSKGCTPVQIALAWILARDEHVLAIPGTRKISHLEENVNAINVVLSESELAYLDNKIPCNSASGFRMPENFIKFSNN